MTLIKLDLIRLKRACPVALMPFGDLEGERDSVHSSHAEGSLRAGRGLTVIGPRLPLGCMWGCPGPLCMPPWTPHP